MTKRTCLWTIARYSILEAMRDRFLLFIVSGMVVIFFLSFFAGELVVTEGKETKIAMLSYFLRIFSVFTISLFVITSMLREFNEKGFELVLSHPVPRAKYYFGKFSGFTFIAFLISILAGCLLLFYAPMSASFFWSVSLFCELMIIVALSLLSIFTLNSITIAFTLVIAFYVLARSIEIIKLINSSPLLLSNSISQTFISWCVDLISYFMPDLYEFTRTGWLIYGTDVSDKMVFILGQTVVYIVLLSGVALFDLYRKEL